MTREKLEQLPHDPGCRTAWLSADAHCTCTRAHALAWVAALETFVAAWDEQMKFHRADEHDDMSIDAEIEEEIRLNAELEAARRALAELEGQ